MTVTVLSPANGGFQTLDTSRSPADPPEPTDYPDLPNPGVSVLAFDVPAGTQTVSILFSPQWNSSFTASNPPEVALAQWSLTSHN